MGKYYYPAIFEMEEDGKIFIDFPDLLIIHQRNVHLGGALEILQLQNRVAAAAHQQAHAGGDFDRFLLIDDDHFDFFHSAMPSFYDKFTGLPAFIS